MSLPLLIDSLLTPAAYPDRPSKIELLQTHISYILLTPAFVYKIKKPVNFGFLDFTTLKKRRFFCEQEVKLNRRLSAHIYLGVVGIVEKDGHFFMDGKGKAVEYAVKMKRLPQERMMGSLLKRGEVTGDMVKRLAQRMASFYKHEKTDDHIASFGSPRVIKRNTEENFLQTERYIGRTILKDEFNNIRDYTEDFLKSNEGLFQKRILEGWIKDCHGDLHSESICLVDDIVIFDCIEFNERFRYSDTLADMAFLAMDLDFHFRHDLSDVLIDEYQKASGDSNIKDLLTFYKVYRAYVRGKVEGLELYEEEVPEVEKRRLYKRVRRYFRLANRCTKGLPSSVLIVVCGLLGTGKTTLAEEIGRRLNALVIHSDTVRKELAGIPLEEHRYCPFGEDIYRKEFTEKTYMELYKRAEKTLQEGRNCILDATYSSEKGREELVKLSSRLGVEIAFVECVAPEGMIRERLLRRFRGEDGSVSDGRWEIYIKAKKGFQPLNEIQKENHFKVDTSKPVRECADSFMEWLGF